MSETKKLKVAFLWHMHQPYYLDPESKKFMMPWARFHALKDYLDMPLMAAQCGVKATFNLVPSLLDQLQMYLDGYTDRHLELSGKVARDLSENEKLEILETFFTANFSTMIEPHNRYRQLYEKLGNCGKDYQLAIKLFSVSEWRDLQVWSNLAWIDPLFYEEAPIKSLLAKGRDFSEDEKKQLLNYEMDLIARIIPTYKNLYEQGKIDISFTPYYHPILPLLIDSDCAKEAIPDIELPNKRFQHEQDAKWQIENSVKKFTELFGGELKGFWPSEGSVSEAAIKLMREYNLKWIATDEEILRESARKCGMAGSKPSPHYMYHYKEAAHTKMFFRDHGLSDKIGFVYSAWDPEKAVNDFIDSLIQLKRVLGEDLDNSVASIILDGENAWEYYNNDGKDFLEALFTRLAEHDEIETVFFSDLIDNIPSTELKNISAGSWINHNFRIWIGHQEDNAAWDALYEARKALTTYVANNPNSDGETVRKAWRQIYIAEGSDWCWWYGDDHIGEHNSQFDELFRRHLKAIYSLIGKKSPSYLNQPIHKRSTKSFVSPPESLLTPQIDGQITHFYEWSGAGSFDCGKAGGAMHRVDNALKSIFFAYDYDRLYIRLDFESNFILVDENKIKLLFEFNDNPAISIELTRDADIEGDRFFGRIDDVAEIAFDRELLVKGGTGKVEFSITIMTENETLEKWPIDQPISLILPEKDKEIFWQV